MASEFINATIADPVAKGVWTAHKMSKDLGKTDEKLAPTPLGTVYATQVKNPKGELIDIEKIVEKTEDEASPACFLTLPKGVIWIATKTKQCRCRGPAWIVDGQCRGPQGPGGTGLDCRWPVSRATRARATGLDSRWPVSRATRTPGYSVVHTGSRPASRRLGERPQSPRPTRAGIPNFGFSPKTNSG
jgi:hypothetical protein